MYSRWLGGSVTEGDDNNGASHIPPNVSPYIANNLDAFPQYYNYQNPQTSYMWDASSPTSIPGLMSLPIEPPPIYKIVPEVIRDNETPSDIARTSKIISNEFIANDPNVNMNRERNIAFYNSITEHGEWLYNLTTSIAEAERSPNPTTATDLSESLNKMLNIKTDDFSIKKTGDNVPQVSTGSPLSIEPKSSSKINDNNEFIDFMNYLKSSWRQCTRAVVEESKHELWTLPEKYVLAHCVSEDFWVNNEIAVQFRCKFESMPELYSQQQTAGGLAILNKNDRFLYYLVTKKLSTDETLFQNLFNSLSKMCKHIMQHKIRKLALCVIGDAFDGIKWVKVKPVLEYFFRCASVSILVCKLEPRLYDTPMQITRARVINVDYPLVDIEEDTIIIYYGMKDGYITDEIRKLNTKFRFIIDYRMANRNIGDIITAYKDHYMLCGFVIKNTKDDQFNLHAFHKCVSALAKFNGKRQNKFKFIGMEAVFTDDDLIMNKLVNILRYSFKCKLDIYVCWPDSEKQKLLLPVKQNGECL